MSLQEPAGAFIEQASVPIKTLCFQEVQCPFPSLPESFGGVKQANCTASVEPQAANANHDAAQKVELPQTVFLAVDTGTDFQSPGRRVDSRVSQNLA